MSNPLDELMSSGPDLSDEEKEDIKESFQIKVFPKGKLLVKEGQYAKATYHVTKGYLREYELIDGEEKTIAFYTEGEAAANFQSIHNKTPSKLNLICEEECTILVIDTEKENALYKKHPRFEAMCRQATEQMLGAKQAELAEFISSKPEQRYLKLQEKRPDLINRVPQYHIASFLGIKAETLSRIRRRLAKS